MASRPEIYIIFNNILTDVSWTTSGDVSSRSTECPTKSTILRPTDLQSNAADQTGQMSEQLRTVPCFHHHLFINIVNIAFSGACYGWIWQHADKTSE